MYLDINFISFVWKYFIRHYFIFIISECELKNYISESSLNYNIIYIYNAIIFLKICELKIFNNQTIHKNKKILSSAQYYLYKNPINIIFRKHYLTFIKWFILCALNYLQEFWELKQNHYFNINFIPNRDRRSIGTVALFFLFI